MEDVRSKDGDWAGLLNGVMFSLLGGAFPAFFVWQIATNWREWIDGRHAMTTTEAAQGVGLTLVSIGILRFGIRLIRQYAVALRRQ